MRRLWAHIIIAASALIAVFASFPSMIKGIRADGDHEVRRQFTFQLSEREKDEKGNAGKKLNGNSAKEIASIMEQRLISYGIESYDIKTSGNADKSDVITVAFTADNEDQYQQITNYLSFSGSFALMNNQGTVIPAKDFRNGPAYQKEATLNTFPTIILPIVTTSEDWDTLLEKARLNPVANEDTSETAESTVARVWLIFNYADGDDYTILTEQNKLAEKTLLTYDFSPEDKEYKSFYGDENKNSLWTTVGSEDTNSNGYTDPDEVRSAYNRAKYLLNLFNASALDYEVECVAGLSESTRVWLDPTIEKINYEGKIVWNASLTACVAAVIIISLLLVVFYRLGALSAITTSVVTIFLAFLFMIRSGMVYNMLALVAFVLVAIVSLVSSIIYLNKLKEDAYRGHTLKKANTEASKKSLLPIIDINVVGVIVGVMIYLLGGASLHTFGAIVGIGSLISLVVNTFGLKGLMWLSTNATSLIGKYEYFGINSENVPNHMAEEKQRYFGAYADRDFTKKKKVSAIGFSSALLVSIVGVILASSLMGGNLLKAKSSSTVSNQMYVSNKIKVNGDAKTELDETSLTKKVLTYLEIETTKEDNTKEYVPFKNYVVGYNKNDDMVNEYKTYEVVDYIVEEGVGTVTYRTTYYVVNLSKAFNLETTMARINKEGGTPSSVETLKDTLENFFSTSELFKSSEGSIIDYKQTSTYVNEPTVEWKKVLLASSIAVAILTVYFLIRYRLTRGLASLVTPMVTILVTLALTTLLSVIGLSIPGSAFSAVFIGVILAYAFEILFMNRERELIIEDKNNEMTSEHRAEIANRAMGMALTPILASAVIGIYLLINFFGFGTAIASYTYLIAILGGLLALAIVYFAYVPLCNLLISLFSKVKINIKPRERKNKKKVAVKKSAEPEEAIFIGIND